MPILGIAGDSFYAATQDIAGRSDCEGSHGRHFTEVLAKKLGYDLFTLARGACSNTCIRFQIEELVRNKVDFVIFGSTSAARLDYPIDKPFNFNKGIYNFRYDNHPDISSTNKKFGYNSMISETIHNALVGYGDVRSPDQKEALKYYISELYDQEYKEQIDSFILSSAAQALKDAHIPYIGLFHQWVKCIDYFDIRLRPDKRHIFDDKTFNPLLPTTYGTYDEEMGTHTTRRYHVSDKNQVAIAEHICDYIKTNNLLVWS